MFLHRFSAIRSGPQLVSEPLVPASNHHIFRKIFLLSSKSPKGRRRGRNWFLSLLHFPSSSSFPPLKSVLLHFWLNAFCWRLTERLNIHEIISYLLILDGMKNIDSWGKYVFLCVKKFLKCWTSWVETNKTAGAFCEVLSRRLSAVKKASLLGDVASYSRSHSPALWSSSADVN